MNDMATPREPARGETAERREGGATSGNRQDAPARQRDIIELHKRLVAMFATLNEGLSQQQSDRADRDREALGRRIDTIADALDAVEGTLRIDLEPRLQAMIGQALAAKADEATRPGRWRWGRFVLAVAAGLVLGAWFAEDIRTLAAQAATAILAFVSA